MCAYLFAVNVAVALYVYSPLISTDTCGNMHGFEEYLKLIV